MENRLLDTTLIHHHVPAGAGFDRIIAEDATNAGRIDLSVFLDDKVFILEFKVDQSGALEQIRTKNYHQNNPVKHRYVENLTDWQFSSFYRHP